MKFISYEDVFRLLSPELCVPLMRETLRELELGVSRQYLRSWVLLPQQDILGMMPAFLNSEIMGVKVISIFHHNTEHGLPSHQGLVVLFSSRTGEPLGAVDGNAVTQIRTGAVSAVATDLLARREASHLALIGAGAQARSHLLAMQQVRSIENVSVFDTRSDFARSFADWAREHAGLEVQVATTVAEATAKADIICTLTPSADPVLSLADVRPGAHINAVGASSVTNRELASDLVKAARFYGDRAESVLNESGDFVIPMREDVISEAHFRGELGALICGRIEGRVADEDITIFESLGLAVEDLAAALYVYQQSEA